MKTKTTLSNDHLLVIVMEIYLVAFAQRLGEEMSSDNVNFHASTGC